jgi:hypothetical protein
MKKESKGITRSGTYAYTEDTASFLDCSNIGHPFSLQMSKVVHTTTCDHIRRKKAVHGPCRAICAVFLSTYDKRNVYGLYKPRPELFRTVKDGAIKQTYPCPVFKELFGFFRETFFLNHFSMFTIFLKIFKESQLINSLHKWI